MWSCGRGLLNIFSPVLVASEKAPEPLVAEPMPWVEGEMWRMYCAWVVNQGVFSFVGLRDRFAGLWAWIGLYPCSR